MLPFLVHKIFTLYINFVLNCKCPAPGPKGKKNNVFASGFVSFWGKQQQKLSQYFERLLKKKL